MSEPFTELLQRAVALARSSVDAGGGPFGALITTADGRIVAEGQNVVTAACDPTAHAEVTAIRRACAVQESHRLDGLILVSSCEPCPMCLAAAWWARLDSVHFASTRFEAANAGFDDALLWQAVASGNTGPQLPLRHLPVPTAGDEFHHWLAQADRMPY